MAPSLSWQCLPLSYDNWTTTSPYTILYMYYNGQETTPPCVLCYALHRSTYYTAVTSRWKLPSCAKNS